MVFVEDSPASHRPYGAPYRFFQPYRSLKQALGLTYSEQAYLRHIAPLRGNFFYL